MQFLKIAYSSYLQQNPWNMLKNKQMWNTDVKLLLFLITHHFPFQKPRYSCTICHQEFTHREYLKIHTATHQGVYRYCCHLCQKGFSFKHAMTAHLASVHNVESMRAQCPVCSKTFTRKDSMKNHVKTIHGIMNVYTGSTHGSDNINSIPGQPFQCWFMVVSLLGRDVTSSDWKLYLPVNRVW